MTEAERSAAERSRSASERRRAIRLAHQLGVVMLASGAETQEVETSMRAVLRGLGLPSADAVVTYGTVTVSFVAPGDEETTTAVQSVRHWEPDFDKLAAAAALANSITNGRIDLLGAETELARLDELRRPYPAWLRFAAPALLSTAITIFFGGSATDAAATLGIGLAIQPALDRIERSDLPAFFQVVFGVFATVALVVVLVKVGLPIQGSLVLTGALLRFLPGAALVSGMHDLISGAVMSGVARLAEVLLIGAAIAGAAAFVLGIGEHLDVRLRITSTGQTDWHALVIVAAGAAAVVFYAVRVGVPRRTLPAVAALGALAVVIGRDLTPVSADLNALDRTFVAAFLIGVIGQFLAHRAQAPTALWMVPPILPLLPAPATLLPLLAETENTRQALQGTALERAFAISVGVASGAILLATYQRTRERILDPVVHTITGFVRR